MHGRFGDRQPFKVKASPSSCCRSSGLARAHLNGPLLPCRNEHREVALINAVDFVSWYTRTFTVTHGERFMQANELLK